MSHASGQTAASVELKSRMKRFGPLEGWKSERYKVLDNKFRSKLYKAMPQYGKSILDTTFGEESATFKQVVYIARCIAYKGTSEQKKAAKEEFEKFEKLAGESTLDALKRWNKYLALMQQWDLQLPEIGEAVDLLKALVKSRIEKMPEEERDSYRDYMMRSDLKNHAKSWDQVVEFVNVVIALIEDNQDEEDVKSKKQALRSEKKGGKNKDDGGDGNSGGKNGSGAQASTGQPFGKSKGQGKGDKVNIPCFAFVRGETCRHGDQCRFVHAMPPSDVCWHWARGQCKKGKNCKFLTRNSVAVSPAFAQCTKRCTRRKVTVNAQPTNAECRK